MRRVTGIGGVFFKSKDPAALQDWYKAHLGLDVQSWGGTVFSWADQNGTPIGGTTTWSIGSNESEYYHPSQSTFMINYRVENLDALLHCLREEGCHVVGDPVESEYGKFGWVMDPDGNKVELWEPPAGQ